MKPTTYLIDTDMSLDDWMAALYLLQNPAVDVRAITVVANGGSHAGAGMNTALRLATLADKTNVEVTYGAKKPLRGNHKFTLFSRLVMDVRLFLHLPRPAYQPVKESAVALLKRHISAAPDKVVILAIGPLTNLAELFLNCPELTQRIAMIYIMGGALNVPGNIHEIDKRIDNPYAEWNIFIDPYATDVVFRSGAPITLIPLDATNQVPLTLDYLSHFRQQARTPSARFVLSALNRIYPLLGKNNFYFWDAIAAVVSMHHEIATFESRRLRVVQDEGRECGRITESQDGSDIRVCVSVDTKAFERIFLDTLNNQSL